jgi:IS5 family transposase
LIELLVERLERRSLELNRRPELERGEGIFGWMKTIGGFRRTRYRGLERTQLAGYLVAAAYNLVRLTRLAPAATPA